MLVRGPKILKNFILKTKPPLHYATEVQGTVPLLGFTLWGLTPPHNGGQPHRDTF
jgi:hypothetical protein